jgi:hypothetical protein
MTYNKNSSDLDYIPGSTLTSTMKGMLLKNFKPYIFLKAGDMLCHKETSEIEIVAHDLTDFDRTYAKVAIKNVQQTTRWVQWKDYTVLWKVKKF